MSAAASKPACSRARARRRPQSPKLPYNDVSKQRRFRISGQGMSLAAQTLDAEAALKCEIVDECIIHANSSWQ
jgi:hypothetical protein